jgi:ParB-like chromosome segregation protein Spo0J
MAANAPVWVGISDLVIASDFQMRVKLSPDVIKEYVELINDSEDPWAFNAPCQVVRVDGKLILVDGFHRVAAMEKSGQDQVSVRITKGTETDALKAALSANKTHGLRRSNADKRRAVEMALRNETLAKWSDRELADECGVSHPFVAQVRGEVETVTTSPPEESRVGSNGVAQPATKEDAAMQRQKIVAAIAANEDYSNRAIADLVGCDHKTVGKVRREMNREDEPEQSSVATAVEEDEPEDEVIEDDGPRDLIDIFVDIKTMIRSAMKDVPLSQRENMWRQIIEQLSSEDILSW